MALESPVRRPLKLQVGHAHYAAPHAPDAETIIAQTAIVNGALTIQAQLDFPRTLRVEIVDANSSVSAGTLTIVGKDQLGNAVTASTSLTGGSRVFDMGQAFMSVTSATVAGVAGATGLDTVSVGYGPELALPVGLGRLHEVLKVLVDGEDGAIGTVHARQGTIEPPTAANNAHNFDFWFTYALE
jgi:hypothetical protein